MKEIKTEQELENLIAGLKACDGLKMEEGRREALKVRLMSRLTIHPQHGAVFSVSSLIDRIRLLAAKVKLGDFDRVLLKEKLLNEVELCSQKRFFWSSFFTLSKKLVSATLLVVMTFGLMSFFNVEMAVVRAATFTVLDEFNGGVTVERDGRAVPARMGMQILENDRVITDSNGTAVIRYFDDSVSRLAGDTEIAVNKLVRPLKNSTNTYVEVVLLDGTVWSRVVNLVEAESAFVVKAMDVSTSAKKAAFNVQMSRNKLEVGVFNHTVDIQTDGRTEKVLSGKKMVVSNGDSRVLNLGKQEKNESWVKENLQSDDRYLSQVEKRLFEEKKKSVGVEDVSEVSFGNSFKQDTLLLLTFDDVGKKKMQLDLAERDFVAAQVKLHDPNLTLDEKSQAEAVMQGFSDQVRDFYDLVDRVSLTDSVYAEELKVYIDNKILLQKKDLSVVLPGSPSYPAKKVLNEMELLSADNETELMQLKVDQVVEKLAIAEDVKERGDAEMAGQVVDEYKEEMTDVVKLIDELAEVKPEVTAEFKEQLADNFDLLMAIDIASPKEMVEVEQIVLPVIAEEVEDLKGVRGGSIFTRPGVEVDEGAVENVLPETVVEGPFGVEVKGDKPLPPLLQDVE